LAPPGFTNTLRGLVRKMIHLPMMCTRAITQATMKSTTGWLKKEEEEEDPSFLLLVVVVVVVSVMVMAGGGLD